MGRSGGSRRYGVSRNGFGFIEIYRDLGNAADSYTVRPRWLGSACWYWIACGKRVGFGNDSYLWAQASACALARIRASGFTWHVTAVPTTFAGAAGRRFSNNFGAWGADAPIAALCTAGGRWECVQVAWSCWAAPGWHLSVASSLATGGAFASTALAVTDGTAEPSHR